MKAKNAKLEESELINLNAQAIEDTKEMVRIIFFGALKMYQLNIENHMDPENDAILNIVTNFVIRKQVYIILMNLTLESN